MTALAALLVALHPAPPLAAQKQSIGLLTASLAGQSVAVLPITMVVVQPGLPEGVVRPDPMARLRWADSLVGAALAERAPEVDWTLPDQLRRVARRNPGLVRDPDHMGQAVMRASSLKTVPDPLRSGLRSLSAVTGGRYVFIPAAVIVSPPPGGEAGVRVDIVAVLADTRTAQVVWRTTAPGVGATATEALLAATALMLPVETQSP